MSSGPSIDFSGDLRDRSYISSVSLSGALDTVPKLGRSTRTLTRRGHCGLSSGSQDPLYTIGQVNARLMQSPVPRGRKLGYFACFLGLPAVPGLRTLAKAAVGGWISRTTGCQTPNHIEWPVKRKGILHS